MACLKISLYDMIRVASPKAPNFGKVGRVHEIDDSMITVYIFNNPDKKFYYLPSQLEVL